MGRWDTNWKILGLEKPLVLMSFRTLLDVGLIYIFGYKKWMIGDPCLPFPWQLWSCLDLWDARVSGGMVTGVFSSVTATQRPAEGGSPFRVNPVLPMLTLTSHAEGKGSLRREAEP